MNWVVPVAFVAGVAFGALLMVLVAAVYTTENERVRGLRDRTGRGS